MSQKPPSIISRDLHNRGIGDSAIQLADSVGIGLVSLSANQKEKPYPNAGEWEEKYTAG